MSRNLFDFDELDDSSTFSRFLGFANNGFKQSFNVCDSTCKAKKQAIKRECQNKLLNQERTFAAERTALLCQIKELEARVQMIDAVNANLRQQQINSNREFTYVHQIKVAEQLDNLTGFIDKFQHAKTKNGGKGDASKKAMIDNEIPPELMEQLKFCQRTLTTECELSRQHLEAIKWKDQFERVLIENNILKQANFNMVEFLKVSEMNLAAERSVAAKIHQDVAAKDEKIKELRCENATSRAWIRGLESEIREYQEKSAIRPASVKSLQSNPTQISDTEILDLEKEIKALKSELEDSRVTVITLQAQLQAGQSTRTKLEKQAITKELSEWRSEVNGHLNIITDKLHKTATTCEKISDCNKTITYVLGVWICFSICLSVFLFAWYFIV